MAAERQQQNKWISYHLSYSNRHPLCSTQLIRFVNFGRAVVQVKIQWKRKKEREKNPLVFSPHCMTLDEKKNVFDMSECMRKTDCRAVPNGNRMFALPWCPHRRSVQEWEERKRGKFTLRIVCVIIRRWVVGVSKRNCDQTTCASSREVLGFIEQWVQSELFTWSR